jgi:hypothetical protein
MIIENFAKKMIASKIFETYTAASFFGTVVFFVINWAYYTPTEIVMYVLAATIVFKGLANIMLAMSVSLVNLDNQQHKVEFEKSATKLEALVKDLAIQEAAVKSAKAIKENNQ